MLGTPNQMISIKNFFGSAKVGGKCEITSDFEIKFYLIDQIHYLNIPNCTDKDCHFLYEYLNSKF